MSETVHIPVTLSPGVIRDALIKVVKAETYSVKTVLRRRVSTLFDYYVKLKLSQKIIDKVCHRVSEPLFNLDDRPCFLPSILVARDASRVPMHVAAAAWLSFDNWRWEHSGYPEFPEDLSYGLVVQYPEPILLSTAYLAGLSEPEFTVSELCSAHEYALQVVRKYHFPELTDNEILDRANGRWLDRAMSH